MFSYPPQKSDPGELVGDFTPEEAAHIMGLRQQFRAYPDQFKLGINYKRLEFARWLVAHGHLDEWHSEVERPGAAPEVPSVKYPMSCA